MASWRWRIVLWLLLIFCGRVLFGLSMPFWFEDERQVYLIGLRAYALGEWPYYGADVVWTDGRIPGALLGLLIRWPLEVWAAPEAPVIFLNVLSMAALVLFAWYVSRRLPAVPSWLVWTAPFLLPWTMDFSTHVVNPSYVLPGAIVFFVGFFEALPRLRRGILSVGVAWMMMGAGLCWTMQLHLSWVLLPPFVAAAAAGGIGALRRAPAGARVPMAGRAVGGLLAGCVMTGSVLAPTLIRDGIAAGGTADAVEIQARSPVVLITTAGRVLSFASFEVNRFLGQSTTERLLLVRRHPWLAPFILVAAVAGILHPLWMAWLAVRLPDRSASRDWTSVRYLTGFSILLIYLSYWLSVRGPQAHAFYVVWPVAALFAFTCWQAAVDARGRPLRRAERVAAASLAAVAVVHAGLAADRWARQSLYVDRGLVAQAIADGQHRLLGERRGAALDNSNAAVRAAAATDDLHLRDVRWEPLLGRFSAFSFGIVHQGRSAAWLDVRLAATYRDREGRVVDVREIVVKQILQPGTEREWSDVADGRVPPGAASATLELVGAEQALPAGDPAASSPGNARGSDQGIGRVRTGG